MGDLHKVEKIMKLLAFVSSAEYYYSQPSVIDGASDLFVEVFGDKGRHARSAVGSSVMPFNIPLEIEMIVQVKD